MAMLRRLLLRLLRRPHPAVFARRVVPGADGLARDRVFDCVLDENTCLECLGRDGQPLPPGEVTACHPGCRCVPVPALTSGRSGPPGASALDALRQRPGFDHARSSAIGPVPGDGGIYKAFLLERARAVQRGLGGEDLGWHLRGLMPALRSRFSGESARAMII